MIQVGKVDMANLVGRYDSIEKIDMGNKTD